MQQAVLSSDVSGSGVRSAATAPLLAISDLSVGYGKVSVLEGVSLQIPPGAVVSLIGNNGAGKSTLVRAISGLLKPTHGTIEFNGSSILRARPKDIVNAGIVHVAEGRRLFRSQSVRDNLALGFYGDSASRAVERTRFAKVMELFPDLKGRLNHPAGTLSGGQQQMLAIGQALMRDPKLLILDEPSFGLAPIIIDAVIDVIVRLRGEGITIFLIEQIIDRALAISDLAYVLRNGAIMGGGSADSLRSSGLLDQGYLSGRH